MPAKSMIAVGASIGICCLIVDILSGGDGFLPSLLAFGSGALFGKGYGLLEERGEL